MRALVLGLAAVEDALRLHEAQPVEDQDPHWQTARAVLAERERVIVEALHAYGVSFAEHPSPAPGLAVEEAGSLGEKTSGGARVALPGQEPDRSPRPERLAAADLLIVNLARALLTRTVIGQAQGILMERHGISGDEAFTRLRICSQLLNRKLRDVASDLVETGEEPLPEVVLEERAGRERTVSGAARA